MLDSIGKYKVIRELGQGATAKVYLCLDPELNRQVAIKLVDFERGSVAMQRRLRKIFKVEKAMGPRLDHPNIIKIYDAEISEKTAYLVMEYVEGRTLDDCCDISNLLPFHIAMEIVFKCCLALDHAYHQGVVHRDIKPSNIMLDADNNPKIADFGLSVYLNKNIVTDSTFIMGAGSPAYMSPEQIKGYHLDQKSDLYSLGIVLFQLLTGRLPFRANNIATLTYKIINNDPPLVRLLNPNLPPAMDTILRKALEKDLYSRYKNGAEFAKDLSAVRYQLVDDKQNDTDVLAEYFRKLRCMTLFESYDNVEIWELIRVSLWQQVGKDIYVTRRGQTAVFGILLEGKIEVMIDDAVIGHLNSGDPIGELAFLMDDGAYSSPVSLRTLTPCQMLIIRSAALSLASEDLYQRLRNTLTKRLVIQSTNQLQQFIQLQQTLQSQSQPQSQLRDQQGQAVSLPPQSQQATAQPPQYIGNDNLEYVSSLQLLSIDDVPVKQPEKATTPPGVDATKNVNSYLQLT